MHSESIMSLLARWLFDVTTLCIRIFSYGIAMRYNKTDRDCRSRSPLEIDSPQFGKYYPPLCFASGNISQILGKQFPIVT